MKFCLLTTGREIIIINTIALTVALRRKMQVRGYIVHSGQKVDSAICFISFTPNCIYIQALPPVWLPSCAWESCAGLQRGAHTGTSALWVSICPGAPATLA